MVLKWPGYRRLVLKRVVYKKELRELAKGVLFIPNAVELHGGSAADLRTLRGSRRAAMSPEYVQGSWKRMGSGETEGRSEKREPRCPKLEPQHHFSHELMQLRTAEYSG